MRIGELAARSALPRDTIRFYERQGLIASLPSADPRNSYRDYSAETLERLVMISEARSVGFSVDDLRHLFQGLDAMNEQPFDADAFLDEKIDALRAQVERSRRLIQILRAAKAALSKQS